MARFKSANTKPEVQVRRALHALGFRFRLHRKDLPGTPDIVLPKLRTAIFVHGCFWHQHPGCKAARIPKSNPVFWTNKFKKNETRDVANIVDLKARGWATVVVWECETKNERDLRTVLLHRVAANAQNDQFGINVIPPLDTQSG